MKAEKAAADKAYIEWEREMLALDRKFYPAQPVVYSPFVGKRESPRKPPAYLYTEEIVVDSGEVVKVHIIEPRRW